MSASAQAAMGEYFSPQVLSRYPRLEELSARVGNTPLIEIATPRRHGRIFAKCEWQNPHGSIKDRVALAMIWSALANGLKSPGATVLEYSGGQLGIALAHMCRLLSIDSWIVLSDGTPRSLIRETRDHGAQVELVPGRRGFWGVMERAFELHREHPDWHFLYQHNNPANLAMHRLMTAGEIIDQLAGSRPDAWVAAIGTGGTLVGVLGGLARINPAIKGYGVTPTEMPYGTRRGPTTAPKFAGSGGLGNGRKQPFVKPMEGRLCGHMHFSYPQCLAEMARFRDQTDIQIGSSAAACLLAARQVARTLGPHSIVATLFPSAGAPEEWRQLEKGGENLEKVEP